LQEPLDDVRCPVRRGWDVGWWGEHADQVHLSAQVLRHQGRCREHQRRSRGFVEGDQHRVDGRRLIHDDREGTKRTPPTSINLSGHLTPAFASSVISRPQARLPRVMKRSSKVRVWPPSTVNGSNARQVWVVSAVPSGATRWNRSRWTVSGVWVALRISTSTISSTRSLPYWS